MSYLNYPTSIPAQTFTYCSDGSFRDSTGLSYISFVKERNGQTYLYQQAVSPLPGLGRCHRQLRRRETAGERSLS